MFLFVGSTRRSFLSWFQFSSGNKRETTNSSTDSPPITSPAYCDPTYYTSEWVHHDIPGQHTADFKRKNHCKKSENVITSPPESQGSRFRPRAGEEAHYERASDYYSSQEYAVPTVPWQNSLPQEIFYVPTEVRVITITGCN